MDIVGLTYKYLSFLLNYIYIYSFLKLKNQNIIKFKTNFKFLYKFMKKKTYLIKNNLIQRRRLNLRTLK